MRKHRGWKMVGIALIAITAFIVMGFVLMGLWNWLMPMLFGLKTIGYWQAVGLFILSKILFGGFRGGGGRRHWRSRMEERWGHMTPEEREKFREGMRGRWPTTAEPKP